MVNPDRANWVLFMKKSLALVVILMFITALRSVPVWADTEVPISSAKAGEVYVSVAHQTIEQSTADLLVLIERAQVYIDEDEPRFYSELGDLLHQYVDFKAFSRAVMGKYASRKRLASMSTEEQVKLNAQIEEFAEVFTGALINTYGKGLLVFEGERIEVVPPKEDAQALESKGRAKVKQLIFGEADKPFEIYYSLRKNDEGTWKIRNMIIESSNLGKIYRNQFDNAYKVYEGDIDRVIENWVTG